MLIKRIQHVLVRARVDPLLTQKSMMRSNISRRVVRQRYGHQLEPLLLLVELVLRNVLAPLAQHLLDVLHALVQIPRRKRRPQLERPGAT